MSASCANRRASPSRCGTKGRASPGGPRQTVPAVLSSALDRRAEEGNRSGALQRLADHPAASRADPGTVGAGSLGRVLIRALPAAGRRGRVRQPGQGRDVAGPRWSADDCGHDGLGPNGAPADGAPPLLPEKGAHRQLRDRRRSRRGGRDSRPSLLGALSRRGGHPAGRRERCGHGGCECSAVETRLRVF